MMGALPRIISVDDHVLEPGDLWSSRLPAQYVDVGPRLVRRKGVVRGVRGVYLFEESSGNDAVWADCWLYEDAVVPVTRGFAISGHLDDAASVSASPAITYDEMLPGCFRQEDRLADMSKNHTDASLCFPTFARFCGQRFATAHDRELALLCVQAYNDFMIDEWCAGAGFGRLIPLTLIPLWDGQLAAAEVRRCADKGSHAVAFSEAPYELGLPSIHSGVWDEFIAACAETDTVINMHIGSSGMLTTTSDDAPRTMNAALNSVNSIKSFIDWMASGHLENHPDLRIAFSEGQIGWIPFHLERLIALWERDPLYGGHYRKLAPKHPLEYMPQVYGCLYDDLHGLQSRQAIGIDQLMFETDYPHPDSTWPNSMTVAEKLVREAQLTDAEAYKFIRGNAIDCYRLDKYFGITE
jgi:predicted TIM-barrel fold metal-dependent hydrolase